MSHSQFDDNLSRDDTLEPNVPARSNTVRIKVGGPLRLDPDSQYEPPFALHFAIIQAPEGEEHGSPTTSHRASRVVETNGANQRWDTYIDLDPTVFYSGDARGIGMAVMEKKGEFAYETITWCDHITLDLGTATGA
jgi:hypothetical protein